MAGCQKVAEQIFALCKETKFLFGAMEPFAPCLGAERRLLSKYIPIVISSEYTTS
jgi:hypothetical protein